jgi:methylated-DNA-[protein]-cysteine S-methyltransferase
MHTETVETPMGLVHLIVAAGSLRALRFDAAFEGARVRTAIGDRVRAYFAGHLRAFDDVPLDPPGTPFQRKVWAAVRAIPAGETRTYGDLARVLGTHPRAVGSANGANPICLAIPCHRVVGASGELRGYAFGLERKRWLLAHEHTDARTVAVAPGARPLFP